MSEWHDQEYADTLEAMHLKKRRRSPHPPPPQRVDRKSPRWRRMRASVCEIHGLEEDLDLYTDRVYRLIP